MPPLLLPYALVKCYTQTKNHWASLKCGHKCSELVPPRAPIFEKTAMAPKKNHNGKNLSSRFSFWDRFWTILNRFWPKEICRKKILLWHFSTKKLPKIEVFWRLLVENFFLQTIFAPSIETSLLFLWAIIHMCTFKFTEIFPRGQNGTTAAHGC